MKAVCLIILILLYLGTAESGQAFKYYEKRGKAALADCSQEEPDCRKCLSISECVWCLADQEGTNGECKETKDCLYRKTTCDSVALDDEGQKRDPAEQSMEPKKVKNETMDADEFCKAEGRADCAHCARYEFCFWCQSTGSCNSYFNETTSRETCPTGNWYKDQCTYPVGVASCPKRTSTCDECLSDNLCYWCDSQNRCDRFPKEDYVPDNCPSDKVYHKDCPWAGTLLLVLLPILAIILIPILIYLCAWLVCCCMRAAGYDPLTEEPGEGPPGERKHRKGIRLKPGSPSNKTDQLRKKYKLGNP